MVDKNRIIDHFDRIAEERPHWFRRNRVYSQQVIDACRPFLNPGSRVLELGCSTGDLLAALEPSVGVGIDISPASIAVASKQYPHLQWICADAECLPDTAPFDLPFDLIIMSDLVAYLSDLQTVLVNLQRLCHPGTRIIISHWNWLWQPILRFGELLDLKSPDLDVRSIWVSPTSLKMFLRLADYEVLQIQHGLLLPYDLPPLSSLINSLSYAPLLNRFTLLHTVVACFRPDTTPVEERSVTVVIPTRNEVGNIEAAVRRTPDMGTHTELLFIDGSSTDGTIEAIHEQMAAHPDRDIKYMPQVPVSSPDKEEPPNLMLRLGKGDAVRKAFDAASGDIVMILDSDLTVPPEELPRFYDALVHGKGRFANGTRLVYPQQDEAMPFLNKIGNVFFSLLFSWLLNQPITDTLCGTKVLYRSDYRAIVDHRSYFGDFDPFGDFDLIFGAARLGLPFVEVPVHYAARTYGDSKVRVLMHGPLLLRMSLIAFRRFKVQPFFSRKARLTTGETSKRRSFWLIALIIASVGWLLVRKRRI